MKESRLILSAPALVLGLGEMASNLLPWVRTLFLQNDPRRSAMMGFYQVAMNDDGAKELKLEAIGGEADRETSTLDSALHELRLHEKYIEIGLGDERDLTLGVIVLVDLVEHNSERLYPLLEALSEKLKEEPGGFVYLLCNTAIFESTPKRNQMRARLYLHLKKLEALVSGEGWRFQIYLFDALKEGTLEARDKKEIGILMQNFLLALLSYRLAQNLAHEYSLAVGGQAKAYFHSAGVTALIYDPTVLQESCAAQLAAATLEGEFLAGNLPAPYEIENVVRSIFEDLGSVSGWAEKLCVGTPYRIKSGQAPSLDLHFSDLEFEELPPQEWGDAIAGYAVHFEKDQQARHLESLKANFASLEKAVVKAFETNLYALPVRSDLYAGGIAASRQTLQECARRIYDLIQSCLPVQREEETAAIMDGEYQSAVERLDEVISALPDPPRWMKRLPGRLYALAKLLFEFLFLRREHGLLIVLREEIILALENKFIFQFEQELRRRMIELCNLLLSILEKVQSELDALQAKLRNLQDKLVRQQSFTPDESSPFRVPLVTPDLVEWAYARGEKDCAGIRTELLETGCLNDWQSITDEHLYQHLLQACRNAYQFVYEFKAEELLKRVRLVDFSAVLLSLSLGAVPALRPDFDKVGESISYLSDFFLCADPRGSDIADLLRLSGRTWQAVSTGDPYLILFCRLRQMIPLNALSFLTQSVKVAFENLTEEEQSELLEMFAGEHS